MAYSPTHDRRGTWVVRRRPVIAIVVAIVLFSTVAIAIIARELLTARHVRSEFESLRAAGYPVDNASMAAWFRNQTSSEGTALWHEALSLATGCGDAYPLFGELPFVGTAPAPVVLEPGSPWPEEPAASAFLAWARPAIDKIEKAGAAPGPVWWPISFQGFNTLLEPLQESRSVVRLLQLDVEHALYHRDGARAMRSLHAMRRAADAFDWGAALIGELVELARRQVHHGTIQRSLACDVWTESDIDTLLEQLGPARDAPAAWRRAMSVERALAWATLSSPDGEAAYGPSGSGILLFMRIPSSRASLLHWQRRLIEVADGGLAQLDIRASRIEREASDTAHSPLGVALPIPPWETMLLPAVSSMASAFERDEESRRLTRASLAIHRFRLRIGDWPASLAELHAHGLSSEDVSTFHRGPFGYSVDGGEARIWTYNPSKKDAVPLDCPALDDKEFHGAIVVIRKRSDRP